MKENIEKIFLSVFLIFCFSLSAMAQNIQVKGNAASYPNEQMFAEVPEKWIDDLI